MSDSELFAELERQQDYVNDLEIALEESQGRLNSLRELAKAKLHKKYMGKSVVGVLRTYYLDAMGELASLEIAVPENQCAVVEETIDRIMSADWQPKFGFGPFSHRESCIVNSNSIYIGFRDEEGNLVITDGEVS